jgi:Tfp pilus tip-associated adhesin PilY1
LDITTGRGFDYTPATKAAKFLWDFTDAELGETWSVPDIERVKVNGSSTQAAWGIYFGSGYAENNNIQPSKEAYLYGLNAATGTALWSVGGSAASKIKLSSNLYKMPYSSYTGPIPTAGWKVGKAGGGATCQYPIKSVDTVNKIIYFEASGAPTCFDSETYFNTFNPSGVGSGNGHYSTKPSAVGQTNNALNSPLVSDFDNDHKADRLYVGDLYGNLYRVSNIGKNETPAVSQLFAFNPMPDSPEKNPIRGKAAGAFADSTSHWIYYGTGRYETPADKTSAVQQYFFGLKDKLASPPTYALGSDMALHQIGAKQTFTLTTGSTVAVRTVTGTNAACKPWAIKLHVPATGASERVFTKPLVVGGIVFFTTFIPDTAACGGDGDTYVFAVDYKTGLPPANPVFDLNGDGKFTDADKVTISGNKVIPVGLYVGRGQGSSPVLFKNTLFITTAAAQGSGASPTGGLHALMVNIPEVKVRVESWKHN